MKKTRSLSSKPTVQALRDITRKLSGPTGFSTFCDDVRKTMEGSAEEKAYNEGSVDGPNLLDQLAGKHFPGHSLGEIFYKTIRYMKRRDARDLEKIAAWAFLQWRRQQKADLLMDRIEPLPVEKEKTFNATSPRANRKSHRNSNKRSRM